MFKWGIDGSGVDHANLNAALTAFDAVVDSGASGASGPLYSTVDAALAAGRRSIFVASGAYSGGFTITGGMDGVRIIGEQMPIASGTVLTKGVRFGGKVSVQEGATEVCLENIGVHETSSGVNGFEIVNTNWTTLKNCIAVSVGAGGSGDGFSFNGTTYLRLIDCRSLYSGSAGFVFTNGGTYPSITNILERCRTYQNGGSGFLFGDQNETRLDIKDYMLNGCWSHNDCLSYGSGGFSIGPRNLHLSFSNCGARNMSNSAAGFYMQAMNSTSNSIAFNNCISRFNSGAGFRVQSGNLGVGMLTGCRAAGNTGLNFDNCSAFKGYPDTCW